MKKLVIVGVVLGIGMVYGNEGEKIGAFLKLGQGARANALGGAYSAISDDSFACYWNPAGLIKLESKEVGFMVQQPMTKVDGLLLSNISFGMPFRNQAFGGSLVYLGYGKEKGYDKDKNPIPDWSASDLAFSCSYARGLNQNLSIGASLKIISMEIADERAKGFAIDAGVLYKDLYPNLNLAGVITNLGTKPKFINESFSLPLSFRLGASYKIKYHIPLLFAFDTNLSPFNIAIGCEGKIHPSFSLRLGYSNAQGEGPGITAGFGVKQGKFGIDYAIKPFGELGLSHYISLKRGF